MKKVLVAGATGYLGRYVVREFKRRGYWVRALARNPAKLETAGPFLEPAVRDMVDEVFTGEITRPETLEGLCDGIDLVFSSIGITRQRNKAGFMDVDYQGNRNLLDLALRAKVEKFVFISVFKADVLTTLMPPRELFVRDLAASGIAYAVVRPTGYFSDMSETMRMAASGRVYVLGDGKSSINPIHGADLAAVCVEAMENDRREIAVGGPETYRYQEIAELAFSVLGTRRRITHIPLGAARVLTAVLRLVSRRYHTMAQFFVTVMGSDFVAPATGTHSLRKYFERIAAARNYR